MKFLLRYINILFIITGFLVIGCEELDKAPLDEVSSETFWQTEDDFRSALNGIYERDGDWRDDTWLLGAKYISDDGMGHMPESDHLTNGDFSPTSGFAEGHWNGSYDQLSKVHTFLENIEDFDGIDEDKKNRWIAEARFFRAWEYFNLSQWYGSVPLVKKELTMDEAASVTCDPKEDIVKFVLDELDQVIPDLPKTVKEHGRVVRGAAYAVKGRLLMSEERWAEAANTYKNLMDMDVHSIDPDYKELFDGRKEESNEIIFTSKYLWARIDNGTQNTCRPHLYMGLNQYAATKDLVDSYLCKDGEPIEECEHYQNADPGIFKEEFVTDQGERYRDPRLYQTLYIPQIHEIDGQLYKAHPDSVSNGDEPFGEDLGKTGYALRKYVAEWYEGAIYDGGNDIPIIRYAEVLLSRLESEIKAGNEIDQDLLDKTINKVRTRESVDLPPVNYNDYNGPMDLWENCVKRERRVELAFEGGIRYWDLVRWDEDVERLKNRTTYGIKVAEEPSESNYPDRLTDEGYAIIYTYSYKEHFHPWPIPQDELDINPNLEQKDNWK